MSDYTPGTNFTTKDGLLEGDPEKIILGADIDGETSAIATAIASKYDTTNLASQVQAEGGTDSATLMTPQRVEQAMDALLSAGTGLSYASRVYSLDGVSALNVDHSAVSTIAGAGLTGGGTLEADRTLNIGAGTGITVSANSVSTDDSAIVHDNLSGFVANEHIDHSTVSVAAGTGLSGGGTIAANRTINLDISGLTAMTATPLGTDGFLYDDGGTMKRLEWNAASFPATNDSNARTFVDGDVNEIVYYTGTGGHTFTVPTLLGQDDCAIVVINSGSGDVTLAGSGVTINTAAAGLVLEPNGVAVLVRESSTVWFAGGTGLGA